jgi:hypothetical protein
MSEQGPSAEKDAGHGANCDGCLMLAMVERAERAERALARLGIDPRVIEGTVTPPAECEHDPRYSRSECGACGHQVSWCDRCGADLCGCVTSPAVTRPTDATNGAGVGTGVGDE